MYCKCLKNHLFKFATTFLSSIIQIFTEKAHLQGSKEIPMHTMISPLRIYCYLIVILTVDQGSSSKVI